MEQFGGNNLQNQSKGLLLVTGLFALVLLGFFVSPDAKLLMDAIYLLFIALVVVSYRAGGLLGQLKQLQSLWPVLLFVACFAFGVTLNDVGDGNLSKYLARARSVLFWCLTLGILFLYLQQHRFSLRKLVASILVIAALTQVVALVLYYQEHELTSRFNWWWSINANAIFAAYGFAFLSMAAIYASFEFELSVKGRLWYGLLAVFFAAPLVLTYSRGGLIAYLAACFVFFLARGVSLRYLLGLCGVGVLLATLLFFVFPEVADYALRAMKYRPIIWAEFLEQGVTAPWLGHGGSDYIFVPKFLNGAYANPHNSLIWCFYVGGALLLGAYLLMLALAFYKALRMQDVGVRAASLALLVYAQVALLPGCERLIDKVDFNWLMIWAPIVFVLVYNSKQLQHETLPS